MTTLGLVAYGLFIGVVGPRLLLRWAWPERSPFWGIVAWQTLTVAVFVSVVGSGLTLAAHAAPESGWVARLAHACSQLLGENGFAKEGVVLPMVGSAIALGFTTALLIAVGVGWLRHRKHSGAHQALMGIVCEPHPEPDVVVLDHRVPSVFCVPGRDATVVVTRGALDVLTASQFQQVLAHERAHLASRHHVVLRWAHAFATVLRGRLGSGVALERIAELIEMHADDAAGGRARRELAEAVVALAGAPTPVGSLGAAGSALTRVRRLTATPVPLPGAVRVLIAGGIAAVLVMPALIATLPGLMSLFAEACPFLF